MKVNKIGPLVLVLLRLGFPGCDSRVYLADNFSRWKTGSQFLWATLINCVEHIDSIGISPPSFSVLLRWSQELVPPRHFCSATCIDQVGPGVQRKL